MPKKQIAEVLQSNMLFFARVAFVAMKETRVFGIAPRNPSFFSRSVAHNLTSKINVKHIQQTNGVGMFKGRGCALTCVAAYLFVVLSSG